MAALSGHLSLVGLILNYPEVDVDAATTKEVCRLLFLGCLFVSVSLLFISQSVTNFFVRSLKILITAADPQLESHVENSFTTTKPTETETFIPSLVIK